MDAALAHRNELGGAGRLRRVALSPSALWRLARDSVGAWIDDYAPSMGAAISYYTAFSIAPLLLIVIALLGLVFGRDAATLRLFAELRATLGPEAASAIEGMVRGAANLGEGIAATVVGVVTVLAGATTVFAELQSALDRIWRTPAATAPGGIVRMIAGRFLSFGMVLAVGFLLLISLLVSAGLAALGSWWAPLFGGWEVVLHAVNFIVSTVVVTVLFALIYKFLPRSKIDWEDVWIGAAVTALLFAIGKLLIGLYIGKSGVVSSLGAAGSGLVVLIWVYYSAQIFLLGAEFTWHYAYRFGSRRGETPPCAAVAKSAVAKARSQDNAEPAAGAAAAATHASPVAVLPHRGRFAWLRAPSTLATGALATGFFGARLVRALTPIRRIRNRFGW